MEDEVGINRLFKIAWHEMLMEVYGKEVVAKALPYMEEVRRKTLLECGTYYVVMHPTTNELVGAGGWTMEHPFETGTDFPHIRHVATHPKYLRQGIGRTIWERCWNDIVQHSGSCQTTVEVFSTLGARAYYESIGFRLEKKVEVMLDESTPFPCFYMLLQANTTA